MLSAATPDSGGTFAPSKVSAPKLPRAHVSRPEICARLDAGTDGTVTVVVGSPGAGKSTLLTEWHAAQRSGSSCWVNVDEGDQEPRRFWRAAVAAVQTCVPSFAEPTLDLLRVASRVDHEVLESLLASTASIPAPTTLILDDLHLAGAEVERQLGFLLSRGTGPLRIVIGSRSDPQIGLPRLRTSGRLVEVRDVDLVFEIDAAGRFLEGLGVELAPGLLEPVLERTEGWAAGLHLAGLALTASDDPAGLVERLSGTNKVIAHYLWSEVFTAQPDEVQRFLLDTCVVDELSPPLAHALSPASDISLLDMEAANLMLRRIDDDGHAFRFHRLFTDLLRFRLESEEPEHHGALHRRAALWYADHHRTVEACRHAFRSGDPTLALEVLDGTVLDTSYDAAPLEELERSLHDADVARSPGPSLNLAVALFSGGRVHSADRLAARVHAALGPSAEPEVAQQAIAVRTIAALLLGDTGRAAAADAEADLDLADDTWPLMTVQTAAKAHVWEGRPRRAIEQMKAVLARSDVELIRMEVLVTIAHAHLVAGELEAAEAMATSVTSAFEHSDGAYTDGVLARAVLGVVALERGEVARAETLLHSVATTASRVRAPSAVVANVALSRAWAHEGDVDAARLAVSSAYEAVEARAGSSGLLDHVRRQEARLAIASGDLDAAPEVIEMMQAGAPRLLAEGELALASGALDAVRHALGQRRRLETTPREALESALLALQLAIAADDDVNAAAATVLDLAAVDGHVFLLAEAGPDALRAIRAEARRRPRGAHVDTVLRLQPPVGVQGQDSPSVVGSLTEREREIVRYMATSLSYREIADELLVSVNTVKTHVKHINQKLGVSSRDEAIATAHELNYL